MSSGEEEEDRRSSRRRKGSGGDRKKSSSRKSSSSDRGSSGHRRSKKSSSGDRKRSSRRRRSSDEEEEDDEEEEREYEHPRGENIFTRGIPAPPLAGVQEEEPERPRRRDRRRSNDDDDYRIEEESDESNESEEESSSNRGDQMVSSSSNGHRGHGSLQEALEQCDWENMHQLLTSRDEDEVQQFFESGNDESPFHTFLCKAPGALSLLLLDTLPEDLLANLCKARSPTDGNTALHLLCANFEIISKPELILLIRMVDAAPRALQLPNQEGDTPLHLLVASKAAREGDGESAEKAVAVLLEETIEIAILQDNQGATPLHVAIAHQAHELVVQKLLEVAPVLAKVPDEQKMLPLHYCAATLSDNTALLEIVLAVRPSVIAAKTNVGDTPLHLFLSNYTDDEPPSRSILHGVQLLTGDDDEGADPIMIQNDEKLTPIHCCALFDCHPNITRTIMKHPSARKSSLLTNKFGATALHMAVSQNERPIAIENVIALGTREAAEAKDRLERTPLHVAAQNKVHATSRLIQVLVELCPAATTMPTQRGHLPLHLAAQSQASPEVVQTLLQLDPQAAQVRNKSSNTPLHNAAKYQADAAVVELLLDTYSDATYVQNQYGNLPLHCATAYQAPPEVIALLLQAWPDGAAMQNRNQDAPLHYAAAYYTSDKKAISSLIEAAPAAVLLLNSSGQSPIDRARANHAPDEIVTLLEESAESWTKRASSKDWGEFSSQGDGDMEDQSESTYE